MENKRFYVFIKRDDGAGWKCNSFDTKEEAKHFAGLWLAEGREVCTKELAG